jgi:SAM-dependent methyltransferase
MKPAALRIFVCPQCKGMLRLSVTDHVGQEVLEGMLLCEGCGSEYPITRGVPRFVARDAYAASFGFQWNLFRTVQIDSSNGTNESERTLAATTGWTGTDYRGRLVLDAGVGAGRFAQIAVNKGGEVVGIDLTTAVDAAYLNIGRHPQVHLAQADIFAMPFRDETFDLAYSIGVLHHTPNPAAAFGRVAATVQPGGGLAVYLYAREGLQHHFLDTIRAVTTRMPLRLVLALSAAAIPLYYLYRVPLLGKVLSLICPISLHPNWRWRWLDTFDTYTPWYRREFVYSEVFRWFRQNRFREIEIFEGPIRMRGLKMGDSGSPRAMGMGAAPHVAPAPG